MRFERTSHLVILFLLVNCKVAEQRATPTPTTSKGVLFYLVSEQYALGSSGVESALANLVGQAIVAPIESNFNKWSTPELRCMPSEEDTVDVKNYRPLDVGDLKLSGYQLAETLIPKNPKSFGFAAHGSLAKGEEYEFETTGVSSGQLNWRQKFHIPLAGSNLQLKSGATGPTYTSPSPQLVSSTDSRFQMVIKRNESLRVSYQSPPSTSYVKVVFSDGSQSAQSSLTCYGSPTGPIEVPAGSFNYFKQTGDGIMILDFVSISKRTDAPKVTESLVLSITRQLHGRRDFNLESGKQAFQFGQLIFD